jgi:hypothetical protein
MITFMTAAPSVPTLYQPALVFAKMLVLAGQLNCRKRVVTAVYVVYTMLLTGFRYGANKGTLGGTPVVKYRPAWLLQAGNANEAAVLDAETRSQN